MKHHEAQKQQTSEENKELSFETDQSADYYKALEQGRVSVAYAGVMLIGAGGVGKSSFLRGMMNLPLLEEANSTQLADISTLHSEGGATREAASYVAKGGEIAGEHWTPVTDDDEMKEIAGIVQLVYNVQKGHTSSRVFEGGTSLVASSVSHRRSGNENMSEAEEMITKVMDFVTSHPDIQAPECEVFLYVWDCGGQPVFLSILPAFLTPKTMFMLMFDARFDLHNRCLFLSHHCGDVTEYVEEVTTKELLLQWMTCIATTLTERDSAGKVPEYPQILPIGTHGDDPSVQNRKDAILEELFCACEDKSFAHIIPEKGFIVNNKTAGKGKDEDPVYMQVSKRVHEFASNITIKVDTPVTWVLFRKVMKIQAKNQPNPFFKMKEVFEIARVCMIPTESVPSVLKFYHDLAVFLHYSNISSLNTIIIANPQWLIKQMAKLLALTGFEEVKVPAWWNILKKKGILIEPLYNRIWKSSDLSPQAIIDLLDHFLILASVNTRSKVHHYSGKEYFVPSVLPPLPSKQGVSLATPTSCVKRASPLHVIFPRIMLVPPGFFTRLATALSKEQGYSIVFRHGIYRNKVSFMMGQPERMIDSLTIHEGTSSVEVTLTHNVPRESGFPIFSSVCLEVTKTIRRCCKDVCQWLPNIETELGIYCDECDSECNSEHFVVLESAYTTDSRVHCQEDKMHRWKPEEKFWLQLPKFGVSECSLSEAELRAVSEVIQGNSWRLKELRDILEMDDDMTQDPVVLLRRWKLEMEYINISPRPYLIHYLMCMDLTEMAKKIKYNEITTTQAPTSERNPTVPDLFSYTSSLPDHAHSLLKEQLDFDNEGVDKDLTKIADSMLNWEEKLSPYMRLTTTEIHDIKVIHRDNPTLQRREALRMWKDKRGIYATYGNLLELCVEAGHSDSAKTVCDVIKGKWGNENEQKAK